MTTLELLKERERRQIADPKSIHRVLYRNGKFKLSSMSVEDYIEQLLQSVGLNRKDRISYSILKIGKRLYNARNR